MKFAGLVAVALCLMFSTFAAVADERDRDWKWWEHEHQWREHHYRRDWDREHRTWVCDQYGRCAWEYR